MKLERKEQDGGPSAEPVLRSDSPVTLLGAGPVNKADLQAMLALAPVLAAADGAAHHAVAQGLVPDAVIGDLDSFDRAAHPQIPADRIHHIAEQDSTDFDKALRSIMAPFVLALGFVGARIDHELAAYHTLIKRADRRCAIIGPEDIVLHVPDRITLDLPMDTRVSLFPMAPVTARMAGLRWSFDALALAPDQRIGTSNAASGGPVDLVFDAPGMLLILPRDHLGAVLVAWCGA
jgi:thiamine pyrophosphokinase